MKAFSQLVAMVLGLMGTQYVARADVPGNSRAVAFSPFNWFLSPAGYAQTPNPGAYLKLGFTGSKVAVNIDVSPLTQAKVAASQYPIVRFSIDGGPPNTQQLTPTSNSILCGSALKPGNHSLLFQYVAGYVFLDFWTPINVFRVTGFTLDEGASLTKPFGAVAQLPHNALFLGDSITNGDDDIATFAGGITNAVDTQDATIGYSSVVAAGIGAEFGVVAYGGASWDGHAADGHTPGLMASYAKLDIAHSRFDGGKLSPLPDDIFINMGENSGPQGDDVPILLTALRAASRPTTNIFVIVPFSGRSRSPLKSGFDAYQKFAPTDSHTYFMDLGNNPYLKAGAPTMMSVDGQHPLATLHALLGAQIIEARAMLLQRNK